MLTLSTLQTVYLALCLRPPSCFAVPDNNRAAGRPSPHPPLVMSQWAKFWVCPGSRRLKDWSKQKKEAKRWTSVLSLRNMSEYISHKLRPLSSSPSTGPLSQRYFNPLRRTTVVSPARSSRHNAGQKQTLASSPRVENLPPPSTRSRRVPARWQGLNYRATRARGLASAGTRALWRI